MYFELLLLSCLRGFADDEAQCQVCIKKTSTQQLLDSIQAQHDSRDKHDRFHDLLNRSTEPFTLVAEYLGRGLFNKIVLVDEGEPKDVIILKYHSYFIVQ